MLARFEAQYETHTERLSWLLARRPDRRSSGYCLAEIEDCRQAIAETARVLQRMADQDFGRCGHCDDDIPVDWLSDRPCVRYCPRCERAVPA
jgi:RNA polymerase-binding transcription factor DksA